MQKLELCRLILEFLQVFPAGTRDKTGFIRNIFHLVMTWPTITMYCVVELVAFLEVSLCDLWHFFDLSDVLISFGLGNSTREIRLLAQCLQER